MISKLILLFNYMLSQGLTIQEANQLSCIAFQESRVQYTALNFNTNGTTDYGLFQINEIHLKTCNTTPKKLLTFKGNSKCAIQLYKEQGLEIWSTYKKCEVKDGSK